ncbi:MAG: YbhN family protein, partial [Anaerolineae bacterium]
LTLVLLLRLGNVELSLDTLRRIQPGYLLIAIAIHYSGFLMRGDRWRRLLGALGHPVNFTYATALVMAGWFVSALIPARLGDVARAWMLRRDQGVPMAEGFGSIAAERALDIFAILLLALLSATLALRDRTPPAVWQTIGLGTGLLVLAFVVLLLVPGLEERFLRLSGWPFYQKLVGFGFELLNSIRAIGRQPRLLALVAAQSFYIWFCDIFLTFFIFRSLAQAIALSVAAFISMTIDLAAAVPLVPGALGQVEATALGLLALFAVEPATGSLMILLNRAISFWTFILVSGLVTYAFGFARALNADALKQARPASLKG